ncbi:hypothetical protein ABTY98_14630 [Streptomyces sp. NPDC096040]|uniref:hypothetical protein n=1 Tax=Streptomyces sp. NPDC096040 TaxID=3155541 RepID=UPI00331B35D1
MRSLTPALRVEIEECECLLIDGTCRRDDAPGGGLAQLPSLGVRRTIFVHMNNTNPLLLEDASERRALEEGGREVAMDGLEVQV